MAGEGGVVGGEAGAFLAVKPGAFLAVKPGAFLAVKPKFGDQARRRRATRSGRRGSRDETGVGIARPSAPGLGWRTRRQPMARGRVPAFAGRGRQAVKTLALSMNQTSSGSLTRNTSAPDASRARNPSSLRDRSRAW